MQAAIRQLDGWAYRSQRSPIRRWRLARMQAFLRLMRIPPRSRILDLGGTPYMWSLIDQKFQVTLVNLPGSFEHRDLGPGITCIQGDATDLSDVLPDKSFDVVFSNSVIEHVGDAEKQAAFAREVQRLGQAYWVQTPSDRFPIEAHTGVPFYWRLPSGMRRRLNEGWKRRLPAWQDMIAHTRVLTRRQMIELFPGSCLFLERRLGFEKSYAAYKPCVPAAPMADERM